MPRFYLLMILSFMVSLLFAQTYSDVEGSKDHPIFPKRVSNFYISSYQESHNDYASFAISTRPDAFIEKIAKGKKTVIVYALKLGAKMPSKLLVRRLFINEVKSKGAVVVFDGNGKEMRSEDDGGLIVSENATAVYTVDGKETWTSIVFNESHPESDLSFTLTVVEPLERGKDANSSSALLDELNEKGKIELYVKFDVGKDVLKSESQPFINEVVKLLTTNPEIKLSIEGHSDNVGDPNANKLLSEKRAKSVMNAIVQGGVDASRLSSRGWGASNPIAPNATEEGKALNRRVELVKK